MNESISIELPAYQWEAILRGLASSGWDSMRHVLTAKLTEACTGAAEDVGHGAPELHTGEGSDTESGRIDHTIFLTQCEVCGVNYTSDDVFEAHLAEARHWEEPGYQLFLARQNAERHREAIEAHTRALSEVEVEIARLTANGNTSADHSREFHFEGGAKGKPTGRVEQEEEADGLG